MKKIYLVLLITILGLCINSCSQMNANQPEPKEVKPTVETSAGELTKKNPNSYNSYEEYSLEGCQYIVVGSGTDRWGSHKGNCSNLIHKK